MNKYTKLATAFAISMMGASVATANVSTVAFARTPVKTEVIQVSIKPGSKMGPDHIKHDAFTVTDYHLTKGVPVKLVFKNFDGGSHSFTSPSLGLSVIIKGASKTGISVTTYAFTPTKVGSFHWLCVMPCDGQAKGWAMQHNNYMAGTITVKK